MGRGVPRLLAAAQRHARTKLTSINYPARTKGGPPGAVGAGADPGTPGSTPCLTAGSKQTQKPKPGAAQSVTGPLER
jgi:hypothetical protein